LGVELLPAEPGALVLAYDLLQKRRREVGPIVVCRAARDHRGGVADQLADDFDRLGGGGRQREGQYPSAARTSACPRPLDTARRLFHHTTLRRVAALAGAPARRRCRLSQWPRSARSACAWLARIAAAAAVARSPACRSRLRP